MPSIGEQGWGNLVSNNFEILDNNLNNLQNQITTNLNNLNNLQDQINVIDTNIGNGTRTLSILLPNTITDTITSDMFEKYTFYDENNVYIAQFGNTIIESISKPPHSCKLMIISVNGDLTINGNIDIYPTTLQNELPPGTPETNIYNNNINFVQFLYEITLEYIANGNNSKFSMNYEDYLNFINETLPHTTSQTDKSYQLSIPHATAAGGGNSSGQNGTAGTAENTCNGGGGRGRNSGQRGGTGCIFGQYAGGNNSNGYGYGSGASSKYRCALIFVINGNLTINESCTITQIGGNGSGSSGGYGGGGYRGGGGGAPVFIYYTGSYVNNGTINTAGGNNYNNSIANGGNGGAGGIKTTKITL